MFSVKKLLIFCVGTVQINGDYSTFFRPRSITYDSTFELALSNYQIYHRNLIKFFQLKLDIPFDYCENKNAITLFVTSFFQKSTNKKALGRYFLPSNKSCISFREDGLGDVGSLWFELISSPTTSFSSNICLRPRRECYGVYFNFHIILDSWLDGLWVGTSFAGVHVRHKLGLSEFGLQNPGTLDTIQTAVQALNNPAWQYSKFATETLSKSGVDDIQLKVGYDYYFFLDNLKLNSNHIGFYILGGIPTGTKPTLKNIFEPLVGTNHGSIGFGFNGDYLALDRLDKQINLMADLKYRYNFKAGERRSIDLTPNGEWSRFLLVVTQQLPSSPQPGINFLTLPVTVKPGSEINLWTALHYMHCLYNFEIGYNLWWRQKEKILFNDSFPANIAIYDIVGDCHLAPVSASRANISQSVIGPNQAPSDSVFTPITKNDLNLETAGHPNTLTSKLYGAVSITPVADLPLLQIGFGASYEFSHFNTAFEQWAIWANFGIEF